MAKVVVTKRPSDPLEVVSVLAEPDDDLSTATAIEDAQEVIDRLNKNEYVVTTYKTLDTIMDMMERRNVGFLFLTV